MRAQINDPDVRFDAIFYEFCSLARYLPRVCTCAQNRLYRKEREFEVTVWSVQSVRLREGVLILKARQLTEAHAKDCPAWQASRASEYAVDVRGDLYNF